MTGNLDEADYSTLRSDYDPNQSDLTAYTDSKSTTIAVIRKPNDTGILDVCDEWMEPLGMPKSLLDEFWRLRGEYQRNDGIPYAHNKAYSELQLDKKYKEYVRDSADAQSAIDEIVERLESGEDVTLVCFEEDGKCCHRHELIDMIESRMSANFTFRSATQ